MILSRDENGVPEKRNQVSIMCEDEVGECNCFELSLIKCLA